MFAKGRWAYALAFLGLLIAEILIALGVSRETAYKDSCKIEHDISQESFDCMKRHYLEHLK